MLYVGPKENTAGLAVIIKSNTLLDLASCSRKEKYIFTHPLPVYISGVKPLVLAVIRLGVLI